ncbi:hypothetical protein ACFSHP_01775 [Novosphingobium panipatense]
MTKAWQCPLTRRVLPRLAFGRSPNLVTTGTGRFDGKVVAEVEFPKLPHTRPLNSEAKQRLADWLTDNELVWSLRGLHLWTYLHDQAALATPICVPKNIARSSLHTGCGISRSSSSKATSTSLPARRRWKWASILARLRRS